MVGGGCLALAGAALQALLKNPLADPFLLGTSGGAAVGAAGAALFGLSPLASPAAAFVGAAAASIGVAALARRGGRLDLQRLLLAGLIANAFFSALLLGSVSIASGEAARTMLFWMMGDLAGATPGKVAALCPYALAGGAVLIGSASRLNLFSVGEDSAAALGVDTERTKRVVFLAASLLTGVAVAFAGVIGFVGLLVPPPCAPCSATTSARCYPVVPGRRDALVVATPCRARRWRPPSCRSGRVRPRSARRSSPGCC